MKVLAINSSPKIDNPNTALILGPFLVSRELMPLESSIQVGNECIQQALDALEKK